jgi:hypothetical protein
MRTGADERAAAGSAVQAQQRVRGAGRLLRAHHERMGDPQIHRYSHAAKGRLARGAAHAHRGGAEDHGAVAISGHAGE